MLPMSDKIAESNNHQKIIKQLKKKANDFLNCRSNANNLAELINGFKESVSSQKEINPYICTLEVVFTELLKSKEFSIDVTPLKPQEGSAENQYKKWLLQRYNEYFDLLLSAFAIENQEDGVKALESCMNLVSFEGKYPIEYTLPENYYFPFSRFRLIVLKLLSDQLSTIHLIAYLKKYSQYVDLTFFTWKILAKNTPKGYTPNNFYIKNYLELVNILEVTDKIEKNTNIFCSSQNITSDLFKYHNFQKYINNAWRCVMQWDISAEIHKEILIVLLNRILPHLDRPVLLTDFLMDSIDNGGAIALLALEGIFYLIQKQNITYANIYQKLYSMFEPEIFHTKFKARLFYLADMFLKSTHLPENLVAAFVKRLSRLSLLAPPQDISIILHFIGNLILRHPGLKKMICHSHNSTVLQDSYIMDERDPVKSNALDSSLWEVSALKNHVLPCVSKAANFVSHPTPNSEFNINEILELKEDDIFDQEISKQWKQCSLSLEKPQTMSIPHNNTCSQYWEISDE